MNEPSSMHETVIKAHLDDLQAEIEASNRTLTALEDDLREMRDALAAAGRSEAVLAAAAVRQAARARGSLAQQLSTLLELRVAILEDDEVPDAAFIEPEPPAQSLGGRRMQRSRRAPRRSAPA